MKLTRNIFIAAGVLIAITAMAAVTYVGNLVGDSVTATNLVAYSSFKLQGPWAYNSDALLLARETNSTSRVYLAPYKLVGNVLVGNGSGFTNLTVLNNMFKIVGGDPTITNGNTTLSVSDAVTMFNVQNLGGGNFTLLSGGGMIWTGAATGNGSGMTNVPLTGLQTVPLTNNETRVVTFSNSVLSGASSASTAPASDEFPTAQWVRSLFNSGTLFYSSTNLATGYTNSDYPNIFYAITNIPPSGVRGYTNTALTAGNYLGTIVTTNRFTQINGPVSVDAYLGLTSAGSPNVSVHPELYYSYDKTNWLGDWSAGNQTLVLARTNLYQWVINIPTTTSTNSTGFYLARRFKVGASSGLVATTIAWAFQGTNSISGTDAASHFSIAGPNSILGNAYLPNTQTFTGSNTFTGGIWGKLIAPTKYIGSTNYTIGAVESIYFADGTNQIVTLPLAPTTGTMITVIAATTTGSVILTNANGSQTICGGLNQTIYQTNRLTVVFDGTNYW